MSTFFFLWPLPEEVGAWEKYAIISMRLRRMHKADLYIKHTKILEIVYCAN